MEVKEDEDKGSDSCGRDGRLGRWESGILRENKGRVGGCEMERSEITKGVVAR